MANLINDRSRKTQEQILEGRFIRMKLNEMADSIREASDKKMIGFSSAFWNNRKFSTTDNEMQYEFLKVHRYVDMRTRAKKDGTKTKKKSYPIHNRVVMGNYSQLTRELTFGFTEAIKTQLKSMGDSQ
jgi:hypothetical protein